MQSAQLPPLLGTVLPRPVPCSCCGLRTTGACTARQIPLFLELDPLTALAGFLTSGTLYRGLALALCIIVPTLFLGRFFCSWVCPLGITSQILGRLFNGRKPADEQHLNAYRPVFRIKYYLLMALLRRPRSARFRSGCSTRSRSSTDRSRWACSPDWTASAFPSIFMRRSSRAACWWRCCSPPSSSPTASFRASGAGCCAPLASVVGVLLGGVLLRIAARHRQVHRLRQVRAALPGCLRPGPGAAYRRVPPVHELHRGLPGGRPALRAQACAQLGAQAHRHQPAPRGRDRRRHRRPAPDGEEARRPGGPCLLRR